MSKKYGSYTDEDLNEWEKLPTNIQVLTSSAFGAWLRRRDERKDNRDLMNKLEKIKAEIDESSFETYEKYSEEPIFCNYTLNIMQIIDNHISELKGENNET